MLALRSSEGRLRGCATTDGGGGDHPSSRTQVRRQPSEWIRHQSADCELATARIKAPRTSRLSTPRAIGSTAT